MAGWSEEEGRGEHVSNGESTKDRDVEGWEFVRVLDKNVLMSGVSEDKTKREDETRGMECELDKVGVHVSMG